MERLRAQQASPVGLLTAVEPTIDEVRAVATRLAGYYNDEHNAAMMAHEEPLSEDDVLEFFEKGAAEGGRMFLLYLDGELIGDADFRDVEHAHAEFAIMIGERSLQGRGLGRRFAVMLHQLAFDRLGLERVYATFVPANFPSMRMFEKIGYDRDDSLVSRSFTDEESDVSMSVDLAGFRRACEPVAIDVAVVG